MISKELLKEVLGQPDAWMLKFNNKNNLSYSLGYVKTCNINIYELAHKCKEWARNKGYTLGSEHNSFDIEASVCPDDSDEVSFFRADTEPEAIFKACEWILENKEV